MRDRTLRTVPNDPAPISRTTSKSLRKRDEASAAASRRTPAAPRRGAAGAASAGLRPPSKVHDPLFVSIESQRFRSRGAKGFTFAGGGASRASRPGPPSRRPKRLRAGPAPPSRGTRSEKPPHSSSSDAAPALASLSTPSVAVEAREAGVPLSRGVASLFRLSGRVASGELMRASPSSSIERPPNPSFACG